MRKLLVGGGWRAELRLRRRHHGAFPRL